MQFLALLGTGVSAYGQYKQGVDAKATANYNAKVDEAEAKAEFQAGVAEEEALRRENAQFFGRQRAAMAESGGVGGSLSLLTREAETLAELDALNVRHNGQLRGTGLLSQAKMRRLGGKAASKEGKMLAGAELLRGGTESLNAYKLSA